LPQLWHGRWGGLLAAIGFGLLVNLVVLGGLVWNEWMPRSQVLLGMLLVALAWAASAVHGVRQHLATKELETETAEDLFPLATGEYLRGNWFEVERLCQQLLKRNPSDMEARLLWASTCRQAERQEEARRRLEEMSLLIGAERWKLEIEGELSRLEGAADEEDSAEAEELAGEPGELAAEDQEQAAVPEVTASEAAGSEGAGGGGELRSAA
jgi:hypothetical protein